MRGGKVLPLLIFLGLISYFVSERMREPRWPALHDSGMRALEEGRYAEAERDLKAAVEASEALGDDDPRRALCLSGLATFDGKETRDAEAQSLFEQALAIREKALGPDHPDVARSVSDLSWIHCNRHSLIPHISREFLDANPCGN